MPKPKKIITSGLILSGTANVVSPSFQTSAGFMSFLKKAGESISSGVSVVFRVVGITALVSYIKEKFFRDGNTKISKVIREEEYPKSDSTSESSNDRDTIDDKSGQKIDFQNLKVNIPKDNSNKNKNTEEEIIFENKDSKDNDVKEEKKASFNWEERCMEIFDRPDKFKWQVENESGKDALYVDLDGKGSFVCASKVFAECKKQLENKLKVMSKEELAKPVKISSKPYLQDNFGRIRTERDRLLLEISICSFMEFASFGNPWAILAFDDFVVMEETMSKFFEKLVSELDWSEDKNDQHVRDFINAISFRMDPAGNFENVRKKYSLAEKIFNKAYKDCKEIAKKKFISDCDIFVEKKKKEAKSAFEKKWNEISYNLQSKLLKEGKNGEEILKIEEQCKKDEWQKICVAIDSKKEESLRALESGKIPLSVNKAEVVENIAEKFFDENGFLKLDFEDEDDYKDVIFNDLVDFGNSVGAKLEHIDDAAEFDEKGEEKELTKEEAKKRSKEIQKRILEERREENEKGLLEKSELRVREGLIFGEIDSKDGSEKSTVNFPGVNLIEGYSEIIKNDVLLNAFYNPEKFSWNLNKSDDGTQHLFVSLDKTSYAHARNFFAQCKKRIKDLQKEARINQDDSHCLKEELLEVEAKLSDEEIINDLKEKSVIDDYDVIRIIKEDGKKKIFKQVSFEKTPFDKDVDFCSFMEVAAIDGNPWGILNMESPGRHIFDNIFFKKLTNLLKNKYGVEGIAEKYLESLKSKNFEKALHHFYEAKNKLEKEGEEFPSRGAIAEAIAETKFIEFYKLKSVDSDFLKLSNDFFSFCSVNDIKVGKVTRYFRKKPEVKSGEKYEEKMNKVKVNSSKIADDIFSKTAQHINCLNEEEKRKKDLEDEQKRRKEEEEREKDISKILNKKSARNILLWTMRKIVTKIGAFQYSKKINTEIERASKKEKAKRMAEKSKRKQTMRKKINKLKREKNERKKNQRSEILALNDSVTSKN